MTLARALRLAASGVLAASAIFVARQALASWRLQLACALVGVAELVFLLRDPVLRRWLRKVSIDQWRAIDAETVRDPSEAGTTSWKVLIILVTVAVSLTLQEYIGDRGFYERYFPPHAGDAYWELKGFAWWSGWRVLGYVIIPMVVLAALPGEKIRDYHVSLRGFFKHLWIYAILFCCVLPAVIAASTTDAFRHTYPFYRMANRSSFDLWTWEALYAAQFVSLEFFFRGFLLRGLRRALGSNAIFVMLVPYCMIHYGKPMPETLGAIGAGLILGTLAMRTKSIWGGVLIHIGVATTMDVLALHGCPPFGSGHWCGE
ncbi:MAG: Abortive infection protein [Myxococcales bacterium]|nr:Abortive infection protein [Myxococcales bacterium]